MRLTKDDSNENTVQNKLEVTMLPTIRGNKKRKKTITSYKYGNEIMIDFAVLDFNFSDIAKSFRCNNNSIDKYIRNIASKDKSAVTYIAIDKQYNKIIAIMTISCSGIYTTTTNILKYPLHKVISAIEIKNFAVDYNYQKMPYSESSSKYETLSSVLFTKYIFDIKEIANKICGAEKIILYSVPNAFNFYKNARFKKFQKYMNKDESSRLDGCIPMFFSLNQKINKKTM